ncbi:MAG: hypoxanthine phosphoribosyltransferase [Bacteroidota bacterium]|nr:hypoxanthine phosphoribosyltransferase [Bacteroidota bacterium]
MSRCPGTREAVVINGMRFVPYLDGATIQNRIAELAAELNREFAGKKPVFVCVLNGAFMFFADLIRRMTMECEVDFVQLSSYGDDEVSSGNVRIRKTLSGDIRGRHVVLVEDIVDSGITLSSLKEYLTALQPASLTVVTLFHKPARTVVAHDLPYVGFVIPPRFVIGYGLDFAQRGRNLPDLYIKEQDGDMGGENDP